MASYRRMHANQGTESHHRQKGPSCTHSQLPMDTGRCRTAASQTQWEEPGRGRPDTRRLPSCSGRFHGADRQQDQVTLSDCHQPREGSKAPGVVSTRGLGTPASAERSSNSQRVAPTGGHASHFPQRRGALPTRGRAMGSARLRGEDRHPPTHALPRTCPWQRAGR